jgi:hypothetical protein
MTKGNQYEADHSPLSYAFTWQQQQEMLSVYMYESDHICDEWQLKGYVVTRDEQQILGPGLTGTFMWLPHKPRTKKSVFLHSSY